jgi:F-box/leucine-rich repeat protein 2/20
VTDIGVTALLKGCRNLEYLNLEGCDRITDNCLLHLPELCPFVIWLILTACPRITVVGLRGIAQKCRHLRYVNVNSALVEEVRKAVAEAGLFRPGLKVSGW